MAKQLRFSSLGGIKTWQSLFVLSSVFIFLAGQGFCQETKLSTNEKTEIALRKAIDAYDESLGRNTMVYTGRSYYDPNGSVKGHQFFGEDYWEYGRIEYDGNTYDSIYLQYDIYRDLILIENFNSSGYLSPITLFNEKVTSFSLPGHYFIRLEKDTLSNLKGGFYDQLYHDADLKVLVKRRKEIVNSNDVGHVMEEYSIKNKFYIKKGEKYHQVKRKKSILKVLADHKKEVKTFIKSKKFRFKLNPDYELVEVVKYYQSLR